MFLEEADVISDKVIYFWILKVLFNCLIEEIVSDVLRSPKCYVSKAVEILPG